MQLILSCYKCGSIDFELAEQPCHDIEGVSYLAHEEYKDTKVTCGKCGLEDYVENLVVTYR